VPHVYLLRCRDGSLYAGSAKDLAARVRVHEAGRASRYTRGRRPLVLVWSCEVATWGEALREERRIKRLCRAAKERLVAAAEGSDA
jgi:putative endonuclease